MSRLSFDRSVWSRRARNGAIVFVVLMVVVGIVGFFVAPGIVKSVAEKQIAEQTGRRATIGAIRINPYVLSATITGFKLYQPDGTGVAADIGEIYANISSASLFRRALVFDELRVVRPRLSIARLDAQRFDFSDIVDKLLAKPKTDDEPARFSLNNISLSDGAIAFDDRVTGRKHVVDHINLGLPFVSNLPYATDVFVTPKFAADVNGSRLELNGKAQPFAKDREATIEFDVADLDLPTYMAFSPVPLKFGIASAKVGTHLVIDFHAAGKAADGTATPQSLALSGHVDVTDLKIVDGASREAITVKRIDVDADRIDPFQSIVALKRVAITEPHVAATRRADGSIDLVSLFAPPETKSPTPAVPAKATPSTVTIASAVVQSGRIALTDETMGAPATTTFDTLDVALERVALQGNAPSTFAVSVHTPDEGTVELKGDAVIAQRKVDGTFRMRHFQPGAFARYIAGFLAARIGDGSIDADAHYQIDASGPALAGRVDGISAHVTRLRSLLPNEKTSFVAADEIALEGGAFDFPTRAFSADSLTVTAPVVVLARDAKGRWNLQAALIERAPAPPNAPAAHNAAVVVKAPDTKPFTALVKSLVVERGDVTLADDAQVVPVRLHVTPLNVKLANIGTAAGAVVPFSIDAGVERRGKLSVDGKLTAQPLSLDANVNASSVAVGWLAAYAGDRLNIVVDSADLNAKGAVRVQPPAKGAAADALPSIAYRGSIGVARLRVIDRVTSDEFVRIKTLDIHQVDFHMPATNSSHSAPMSVALGPVAVDDFYARVIVNNTGRLNLQDVVATPGQTKQSVTTPEAVPKPVITTPAAAETASTAPKPQIRVKGVKLTNGRVGITDNFVKPNYSANLTDLDGEVSSIASDDPKPATVKLDGKIDGDGVLTVSGQVNPLAPKLFVDIAAEAKDIELTRLTPYAVKYAGYAIARGKLSTTVKYHIENDKLDAQNRLFLDQLTFGEKVDSPTATKLPVLLAVSLLKNSRGEIDVNLPVSGSLTDPEFSIGGVIVRVIVNLLTRAVAAPFSLIASAFGGGADELGYVEFKPGVSDMTPQGKAKLETLAKALADRPALKLDIIGRYDPATDPEGIKRDHLLDRLKDAKAKDRSKGGERVGRDDVTIEPAEYATWLAKVYDDTKLPDKPRNVVGIAKSVPVEDMEKLLLANMKLDENDPRWLAEARADVVRHYIEDTGKVSPSRVFLVTPKLNADGINDKGLPTRVDFALR